MDQIQLAQQQFGELIKSELERIERMRQDTEIKDFSKLIPEHGGVLDRIDSTIATAPMVLGVFVLLQYMDIIPW